MSDNRKKIQINFKDGTVSTIDERVYELIVELQKEVKHQKYLPLFWNLSQSLNTYNEVLLQFYSYLLVNRKISRSQIFQDLFVLFNLEEKRNGSFLEFGATDGVELSNSFLLESNFGWKGVLAEPNPRWHKNLKINRPNSTIITECIYSETGKDLDFYVSDVGALSTIEQFRQSDISSMPGNANTRNSKGYNLNVPSISLNDVFIKYFNAAPIDYMSVDTEGSELLILENFDFPQFSPRIVTVEHNFTDTQDKLDRLFEENNYIRVFKEHAQFDAWYVLQN